MGDQINAKIAFKEGKKFYRVRKLIYLILMIHGMTVL